MWLEFILLGTLGLIQKHNNNNKIFIEASYMKKSSQESPWATTIHKETMIVQHCKKKEKNCQERWIEYDETTHTEGSFLQSQRNLTNQLID